MNTKELLQLIEAVSKSELTCFEYERENEKIKFCKKENTIETVTVRSDVQAQVVNTPINSEETKKEKEISNEVAGNVVMSPLVGTFYAASGEGEQPYVKVGDKVKKGQVLAIVEAMKLMNEIECEYDGVIEAIYVENAQPVEYGQPLFLVR